MSRLTAAWEFEEKKNKNKDPRGPRRPISNRGPPFVGPNRALIIHYRVISLSLSLRHSPTAFGNCFRPFSDLRGYSLVTIDTGCPFSVRTAMMAHSPILHKPSGRSTIVGLSYKLAPEQERLAETIVIVCSDTTTTVAQLPDLNPKFCQQPCLRTVARRSSSLTPFFQTLLRKGPW